MAWVILAIFALTAVSAAVLFSSPGPAQPSLTTNTASSQLKTSTERVAFLGRYVKYRAHVRDAAFHVWWQDNSGFAPGPSDWTIVAALRVDAADAPRWLDHARPVTDASDPFAQTSPAAALVPAAWGVTSAGTHYERGGALLVWHAEGVLELSAQSDPGLPAPTSAKKSRQPCACPASDPLCSCL
jgi:hypothetical protein